MKRLTAVFAALTVSLLVSGCSTKNLDEKLDAEYSLSKGEWKRALVDLENVVKKQENARKVHDEQDSVLAKFPLSTEDKAAQARHKAWFAEYEKTLNEAKTWMNDASSLESRHISMEAAHDTSKASKIRADHELMLKDVGEALTKTNEYISRLNASDSTIETFFSDHARFNQKYGVPSMHGVIPPTKRGG
ncbi:hypothetical protein GX441_08400 [bacterium]|nr:hypothetical protein [bacterium]